MGNNIVNGARHMSPVCINRLDQLNYSIMYTNPLLNILDPRIGKNKNSNTLLNYNSLIRAFNTTLTRMEIIFTLIC